MSFDLQPSTGPIFLAAGQSVDVTVWFGNPGDDRGAQWIMAHPVVENFHRVTLQVSNFRKILDFEIIGIQSDDQYIKDDDAPYYRYRATVTNVGRSDAYFRVQGGGND